MSTPAVSAPVSDMVRLLLLSDANTRTVLIGTAMLGAAAGAIGAFAVLRRRALVGDAISHAALPGICIAYFLVGDRDFGAFLLGAAIAGLAAAACISAIRSYTRIKEDAAIGMVLSVFFGLGIVLSRVIQNEPAGNRAGLDGFIFGKAASMVGDDVRLIGAVAAGSMLLTAALFKEFKLLCFDRDFARSIGRPVGALDVMLMALVAACTVAGLPAVGVVLMSALLIIPAAAARFWSDRLGVVVVAASAFGAASGIIGSALSAVLPAPEGALSRGWPTGPLIVLVAASLFVISLVAAPRRGIASAVVRRRRLRRRIGVQNLLRAAWEACESRSRGTTAPSGDMAWTHADLLPRRGWSPQELRRATSMAARAGLVEPSPSNPLVAGDRAWRLTALGATEAMRIVRAHRLWELYLIEQASIAPDHVDRDADELEHVLPRDVLAQLEARLMVQGRLPLPASPTAATIPVSPHNTAGAVVRGR